MSDETETQFIRKRSVRMETYIIIFKGLSHLVIGVFTPWTASLAQWVNSGTWPEQIVWMGVILPASAIGGASALQAFLSGSYSSYQQQKQARENTTP